LEVRVAHEAEIQMACSEVVGQKEETSVDKVVVGS
jgi:hypothetical protein